MNTNLRSHLETHQTIDVADARRIGVSRAMLSYLAKKGELVHLAQGVYALPEGIHDDLAIIAARSSSLVFSHETALSLHGLHNRIPSIPSVTVPTGKHVPHSLRGRVSSYHIAPSLFSLGASSANTFMGNPVPCYDRERTICDIIRSHSRLDVETYTSALRNYASQRTPSYTKLFKYAELMGIGQKVRTVMEVLA